MSIFEELMKGNRQLTESMSTEKRCAPRKVRGAKIEGLKKISLKNIKVESIKIFEDANLDDLDAQFAVDPEEIVDDEVVLVIDPEIPADEEVPEEAAEELVGDYVYKCPVCGSNYICDCDAVETEAIEVDEEGVPTECPICGDDVDQILIGEIAPIEDAGEEVDFEPVDADDAEEVEETEEGAEDAADEVEVEEEEEEEIIEDSLKAPKKVVKEGTLGKDVAKYQMWVDYDMKHYGEISKETLGYLKKAGLEAVKDKYGDYEVIAKAPIEEAECSDCHKKPCECTKAMKEAEEFEAEEETEEDENKEESEEVEEVKDDEDEDMSLELIEPAEEIKEDEEVEIDGAPEIEVHAEKAEFFLDDHKFESLMTKMIRENYKGTPLFKLQSASFKGGKLVLEYTVGKNKGTFVAEGFDKTARVMSLKIRDKGQFTESYTKTPSFVVECVRIRNKIIPTSLKYNFIKKVNESFYKVRGSIGKQK